MITSVSRRFSLTHNICYHKLHAFGIDINDTISNLTIEGIIYTLTTNDKPAGNNYGIPKLTKFSNSNTLSNLLQMHGQTQIHCQFYCKCMGKLKHIVKFVAGHPQMHAWSKCDMNANALSALSKANTLSNANTSSALSNTNTLSNVNASSALLNANTLSNMNALCECRDFSVAPVVMK